MKLAPPVATPHAAPKAKAASRRVASAARAVAADDSSESDAESNEGEASEHASQGREVTQSSAPPPTKPSRSFPRPIMIGAASDPLEHQADAIADRVMRAPLADASTPQHRAASLDTTLRRACRSCCSACEDEDELRREPAAGQRGGVASESFSNKLVTRMRAGGSPLTEHARSFLEPRLGASLRHLRVHDDADASSLTRSVGARAFTIGRHLFFGAGELRPHTPAGMRLLAHEVAHTLQAGHVLRRSPESDAVDAVDTGGDLLEQNEAIQASVDRLRRGLHRVLVDLVMPNEEGVGGLDDFELPSTLRSRAKAAVVRYRKVTRYLEVRSTLESVLMIQWLDAALEVIDLLRQCIKYIAKHDEFVGGVVEADYGKTLRRLGSQAKGLREHPFFEQGEAIEAVLRPLEEAEGKAEIERQQSEVRREMLEVWSWQSREAIEAELARLQAKQNVNGRSETGVLEVQLEVLGMLADPSNFRSKGTVTARARELAGQVESDIDEGARALAEAVAAGELGVVVDAFRWVAFEQGETRVERIAPMILLAFRDPSQLLSELDASQQGQLVMEWLAPPKRPELQFAMSVLWADPDGASSRSPEDARAKLLDQSRAARATSVITATGMLQSRGRLARYAESAGTRSLLIEMAYQLWLDGFSHRKVATGDLLAATLAAELDAERAKVIEDGELSIEWVGDDMRVSVDPFFNAKPSAVVVPASASVWLHGVDEPLMPALKLLELEARGDRNALVWAGQEIAHGAGKAGEAAKGAIERAGTGAIELGEDVLDASVAKAREVVTEYVPEEYQTEALAVVSGLELAGNVALDVAAFHAGYGVGLATGAIDTTTGLVSLGGGALAGVGELGSDALEGDVLEDVGVAYRQAEHTLLVTVDAVPEIAEALYGQFQEMEGRDRAFVVGKATGMVAFEVGLTIATSGTSAAGKVAKAEKLADLGDLAKSGEAIGDVHFDRAFTRNEGEVLASIRKSGSTENPDLTRVELGNELEYIVRHPELVEGQSPHRRIKIGDHEWIEYPDGRWCRHSNPPHLCALDLSAAIQAARRELTDPIHQTNVQRIDEPTDAYSNRLADRQAQLELDLEEAMQAGHLRDAQNSIRDELQDVQQRSRRISESEKSMKNRSFDNWTSVKSLRGDFGRMPGALRTPLNETTMTTEQLAYLESIWRARSKTDVRIKPYYKSVATELAERRLIAGVTDQSGVPIDEVVRMALENRVDRIYVGSRERADAAYRLLDQLAERGDISRRTPVDMDDLPFRGPERHIGAPGPVQNHYNAEIVFPDKETNLNIHIHFHDPDYPL